MYMLAVPYSFALIDAKWIEETNKPEEQMQKEEENNAIRLPIIDDRYNMSTNAQSNQYKYWMRTKSV